MSDSGMNVLKDDKGLYLVNKGGLDSLVESINKYVNKGKSGGVYDFYRNAISASITGRTITLKVGKLDFPDTLRLTISDDDHYLIVTGSILSAVFYLDGTDGFYQPLYPVNTGYLLEKAQSLPVNTPAKLLVDDIEEWYANFNKYMKSVHELDESDLDTPISEYTSYIEEAISDGWDYDFSGEENIALMIKSLDDSTIGEHIDWDLRDFIIDMAQKPNEIYSVITDFINAVGLY